MVSTTQTQRLKTTTPTLFLAVPPVAIRSLRPPLLGNTGLLNQNHRDATASVSAFSDGAVESLPSATIIAMLQQQQHLLQEVISTQQGIQRKQSDFD